MSDDRLQRLINLEELDVDLFRAECPDVGTGRVFGGQVAAQALRAATMTVEVDHHPHSLHAYFLRPGRPGIPIILHVDEIRNGRSFTTRRVVANQRGKAIFNLSASFHTSEPGIDWAQPMPLDIPTPDELDEPDQMGFARMSPFDMRTFAVERPDPDGHGPFVTRRMWVRSKSPLPDDPHIHACMLAFVSDMGAVSAARAPVDGHSWGGVSLDHAMWFHRNLRADEWVFYELESVSNHGARGLARGNMFAADGTLGASVTQEGLLRPGGSPSRSS